MNREHDVRCGSAGAGKHVVPSDSESFLHDPARQRKPVRVQATAGETHELVSLAYKSRTEHTTLFHPAHDEPREVVVRRRVQPRHLCRLTSHERASVLQAARGDAGHDGLDGRRHQRPERHVVEEEERHGTLHEDVVDAVVHEVVPDRVVPLRLDRHLDLGTHAIGTGHEQGAARLGGHLEHSAKAAEPTARAYRERRLDQAADALLGCMRGVEVHPCLGVPQRFRSIGHVSSDLSNDTSSWNSATRSRISARVISSNRAMENPSTTKEPMADPWMTARRRFASLRSSVRAR